MDAREFLALTEADFDRMARADLQRAIRLIEDGECSAACVLADDPMVCECRCEERFHGLLQRWRQDPNADHQTAPKPFSR